MCQPGQVPVRDLRLPAETVAPARRVGGVGRPIRIVVVDPAIRAVVDGQAEHRHVVGVHHAVHETHPHPFAHQPRGPLADRGEPVAVQRLAIAAQSGKITADAEIGQLPQQGHVTARGRQLEIAEAQERRRHAADDRTGFGLRMPVVEHVAHHRFTGRHQAQRTGGGNAEMMHRLAAQELANRGAQHRTAVGGARIRRRPGPLQLQFPAPPLHVHGFPQRDRPAIAQLAGPGAKLVTAVVGRERLHARPDRVAAEYLRERRVGQIRAAEAQRLRHLARPCHQARRGHRCRRDRRPQGAQYFPPPRSLLRVAGQFAHEGIVVAQRLHGDHAIPSANGFSSGSSATRSSNTKQPPS